MRLFTTLLILAVAVPAFAQVTKQERAGIVNFSKVDAVVACGGATDTAALEGLKADGFKAIINLRQSSEEGANVEAARQAAAAAGLTYIHIPFSGADPKADAVDQFLASVQDPANSPVFIHCASANRVGMMWLIKRVVADGWPLDKATEEAQRIGLTNPRLKQFALDYLKAHGKA